MMDDATLQAALRRLGPLVAFPETPDLSARVTAAVAATGPPRQVWRSSQRLLALAAVLVLVTTGLIVVSPRARAIADDFIHLRGLRVESVRRLPPAGSQLHLGRPVSLAEAGRLAGFHVAEAGQLGPPDAVYMTGTPGRFVVSLVYRARPGLPVAAGSGAAVVLSEFRGTGLDPVMVKKLLAGGTSIDQVSVGGQPGYWIAGPQVVVFIGPDGRPSVDQARLSGSTVLWAAGGVTYRLELTVNETAALRIADTVR